jgi:curli production assembly/transport component CsgG
MRTISPLLRAGFLSLALGGCGTTQALVSQEPTVAEGTGVHGQLVTLPAPVKPVLVAVYGYQDQTGQYKASDAVQSLSRAVTQGATSVLIKALQDAGRGDWFKVVERERLDNLLKERQIIRETRTLYEGGADPGRPNLPPLLFAGLLLEGGIIGYDSDTLTGGFGAAIMGIGGFTNYRRDTATVYLRAVSTSTGEILASVNVTKTIFSVQVQANVFRYVASDEILELETGFTTNEPTQLAIKQAVEKAVIAMVAEGAGEGLWAFRNAAAGEALVAKYTQEKLQSVVAGYSAPSDDDASATPSF